MGYQRRVHGDSSADTAKDTTMRSSIISFIFLSVTSARPQFEVLKSIVSEVVGDIEQVPYTVLQKFDGYEMMRYPSVNWVCSEATYKLERDSENNMFMKLFRYISGANMEQEKVDMTIPVLTRMKMLENRMVNKEMCFYLNKAHQANPPSPTNPEVKIVRNQELTVFVHTFGGYANKDSVNLREGRRFAEVLREAGQEVDTGLFYTASYDSPMKFWNRRNEVMFLVPGTSR